MGGERNAAQTGAGGLVAVGLLLAMALGGCSAASLNMNLFGISSSKGNSAAGVTNADADAADYDTPCPEVKVRTGAATLMVGNKPSEGEPAPLDVRYQGSIVNYARECHLNAGLLTVKVGVEGRIITGPAGGPGTVNVPLRIAVVHEGVNPTMVVTKLTMIPVTVSSSVDRVTFTHVDPDIAFALPQPASSVASYVIYVGFDPLGAHPQKPKKPAHKTRAKQQPKQKARQKPQKPQRPLG
jgi:hypothetical protein